MLSYPCHGYLIQKRTNKQTCGNFMGASGRKGTVASLGVISSLFPPTLILRYPSWSSHGLALTLLMVLQSVASCRVREKSAEGMWL